MFPPFPQSEARLYCLELISKINKGELVLEQISQLSEERQNLGLMIGCLVCADKFDGQKKILYALSGRRFILKAADGNVPDFTVVPSIVEESEINQALEKNDREIHLLTQQINDLACDKDSRLLLIEKRTQLTTESLQKVFNLYSFTRFDGKTVTLNQIIKEHNNLLPPTGTGDCCAPKLLSYAFSHNLQPLSMDEIFFGNDTKNKINGKSYPPCDERCGYILPWILGLEILYRDENIVIVNKQSGLLSVPGRTEDKKDCLESRLRLLFPECIVQPAVHRLDMETSGLLIMAFTKEAHKNLNMQFAQGSVQKKYEALLDGCIDKATGLSAPKNGETEGRMELKFRLDVENRPHQIYDEEFGKLGITEWKKENVFKWKNLITGEQKVVTQITFIPHTGRTHQLRLAASDFHGFGMPILGDTLYGSCKEGERLMLHAKEITFKHPVTDELMHFECPPKFM